MLSSWLSLTWKCWEKAKKKNQCSLYPIHKLLELFSFTSLPSLCCKIELTCLSLSSAGHLAVWPHNAANEGIEWAPCWRGCGCTGDIQQGRSCQHGQNLCSLHGAEPGCSSFAWVMQKQHTQCVLVRAENLSFSNEHLCPPGLFGTVYTFLVTVPFFCCYEVILVILEVNLENQLTVTSSEDASCWYQNTWILV